MGGIGSPKVVQERLGQTSINTTMDVYSHALPGMQSQVAESPLE
jgi:integrase